MVDKLNLMHGMVHAWVGQKLLKYYIFKSFYDVQSWALNTDPTSTNAIQQPLLHKVFCQGDSPNKLYTHLN